MKKLAIILLTLIVGACSSIKVTYDIDKTVDFSQYKTAKYYGWQNGSDSILNRFDKERIENAFENEFNKRDISITEDENADLIVSLYVLTEKKILKTANTHNSGGFHYGDYYGDYYYGPDWGWGSTSSTTTFNDHEYEVGALIISVYDTDKKELVWQGIVEDTIDNDPEKRDKTIPKMATAVMKNFPLKPV